MAGVSVTVHSRTRIVEAAVLAKMAVATGKAAHDIEADAKTRAPVLTGNLKNSLQASGDGVSWRVDAAANYAVYVEFGTSRAGAQPYLVPAVERVRPVFLAALRSLVR